MLKYVDTLVGFSEVPDEISLCINISGCKNNCKGCHSSYLKKDVGQPLTKTAVYKLIEENKGITCVCFMGGEQNPLDLIDCLHIVHQLGLKTCLYSGVDSINYIVAIGISSLCDYIKVGHYDERLGGLNSLTTNQKFFSRIDGHLVDTTYKFQKGYRND